MFSKTFVVVAVVAAMSYTITRNLAYGDEYYRDGSEGMLFQNADVVVGNTGRMANFVPASVAYAHETRGVGTVDYMNGQMLVKYEKGIASFAHSVAVESNGNSNYKIFQVMVGYEVSGKRIIEALTVVESSGAAVRAWGRPDEVTSENERRGADPNVVDTDFSGGLSDTLKAIKEKKKEGS